MSADYKVQLNAKIGDHLVNVNGETAEEALVHLEYLAANKERLHEALTVLDGRSATEIVQKEKQWGARSQGGRTYPAAARPATAPIQQQPPQQAPQQQYQQQFNPQQELQQQLGAVQVSQQPNGPEWCGQHGQQRVWAPAGTNKFGKDYNASFRCPTQGCPAVWQKKDGSY